MKLLWHFPHSSRGWVLSLLHEVRLSSLSWLYSYVLSGLRVCHALSFSSHNSWGTLGIYSVGGFLIIIPPYIRLVSFTLGVQFERQACHVLSVFCSLRKRHRKENSSAGGRGSLLDQPARPLSSHILLDALHQSPCLDFGSLLWLDV